MLKCLPVVWYYTLQESQAAENKTASPFRKKLLSDYN